MRIIDAFSCKILLPSILINIGNSGAICIDRLPCINLCKHRMICAVHINSDLRLNKPISEQRSFSPHPQHDEGWAMVPVGFLATSK